VLHGHSVFRAFRAHVSQKNQALIIQTFFQNLESDGFKVRINTSYDFDRLASKLYFENKQVFMDWVFSNRNNLSVTISRTVADSMVSLAEEMDADALTSVMS
jgi:hypothetical protein